MRRFVMGVSILLFLVIAAAIALSFLVNALELMGKTSKVDPVVFIRFRNNPIEDLGYAGAAMITGIGVLLVCLKYVLRRSGRGGALNDDENERKSADWKAAKDAAETPEDEEASDHAKLEKWKRTHKL